MKECLKKYVLTFLVVLFSVCGYAQAFNHPGVSLSSTDIAFVKAKVEEGAEPWKSAYDKMIESDFAQLSWTPQAIENVQCGFFNAGAIGCREQSDDAIAAYTHAIIWALKGDQRHANKAIQILNNWRRIHEKNEGNNSPLQVGWVAPGFVDAAEILRYTNAGWSNGDITAFSDYLRRVYLPIVENNEPWPANWLFSVLQARLAIAVFTNDRATFNKARDVWRERIKTMIYQETDGPKPVRYGRGTDEEMQRNWFGSWNRNRFFDGFSQETCRDIGHLFLGTKSMTYSAQILFKQGVDVFNEEKKRLKDFAEFHSSLINGGSYSTNICGGPIMLDGRNELESGQKVQEDVELLYYHLNDRLQMNLPETKKLVEFSRPVSAARWFVQWETLLYARDQTNQAPVVSFTSPANNSTFELGEEIIVSASSNDPDGNLDRVNFFVNDEIFHSDNARPFAKTFMPTATGTYTITARAIDKENLKTDATVTINVVRTNVAPTVNISSPANNVTFELGEEITIKAGASDIDGNLEKVNFFINDEIFLSDTDRPFEGLFSPTTTGTYTVIARAIDRENAKTDATVTITVVERNLAPTATFITPIENRIEEDYPELVVTVEASDPNGDDFSVLLKINGQDVRSESVAPYEWGHAESPNPLETVGLTSGDHLFEAVVTDEAGLSTTISKTITVDRITSTTSTSETNEVVVFPNPSSSGIFKLSKSTVWEVYNFEGILINSGEGDVLDLKAWSKGMYYLKINNRRIKLVH